MFDCMLLSSGINNLMLLDGGFSLMRLVIALVVGGVIAFIVKSGMSNVKLSENASYYVRENSLDLAERNESFLYTRTTKTKINDDWLLVVDRSVKTC